MKVAIYARCSTQEQSVALQLEGLREYAEARGFEIVAEFTDEGVSGAKAQRPALDEGGAGEHGRAGSAQRAEHCVGVTRGADLGVEPEGFRHRDAVGELYRAPVDGRAVLAQVVSLPLTTWNYKAQDDSIRHIGPMAQDFHAAFGLGVSDKLIDTIDPDGVALAAIQGLNELVQEKVAEIAENKAVIEELRARLEHLEVLAMSK